MKRIPKSFTLGGYAITVKMLTAKEMLRKTGDKPAYGLFVPGELAIYLEKPSRRTKKALVIQTFWHEFFHAAFWVANHQYDNEKLVDHCGHLMAQFFETSKF